MPPTEIVVMIPGIMGSVLETPAGDRVWPARGCGLLMQFGEEDVDALLADDLRATDLIRKVSVKSVYQPLLDLLEGCGYREYSQAKPAGTLYPWPYDWRRDLRDTTAGLADFLDGIHAVRGDVEFTVIAHSMGGLVARTYLESKAYVDRPARPRVKRLFTLGTPHQGAPIALGFITGKLGKLWLSADQVKRVVNDVRYPSTYQLLPPDDEPFLWDRGGRHDPLTLDGALAGTLGLNVDSLRAMREWRATLDPRRMSDVRLFCFVGSTHETVTSVWLSQGGAELALQGRPSGGDATVPFVSATIPGRQHYEVEGEHGVIFNDDMIEALLPRLLGKRALLAVSETGAVQLSLAEAIVPRTSTIRGVLILRNAAAGARRLSGRLQVVPQPNWQWPHAAPAAMAPQQFDVNNIQSERLTFELPSPAEPGAYTVTLTLRYDRTEETLEEPVGIRQDF